MSRYTLTAAIISTLALMLHIIAGGEEYHAAFQATLPTAHLSSMAAVLWHAITVYFAILSVTLFWLAKNPDRPVAYTHCAILSGWAVVFIFYGVQQLGNIHQMPQWFLFLALAALMFLGRDGRRIT